MIQLDETMRNKGYKKLAAKIAYGMKLYDLRVEEMAESIGVCTRTWYQRMKDPKNFRIYELEKIARILDLALEELVNLSLVPIPEILASQSSLQTAY